MSDLWQKLRERTRARVALGRSGAAMKTRDWLEFQRAHAEARDAVWSKFDAQSFAQDLRVNQVDNQILFTQAISREEFLLNPSLGRELRGGQLIKKQHGLDLAIVVSDGLSARAVENEFLPFWREFVRDLPYTFSRAMILPFGRVAVADEVGEKLGAKMSLMFIGERPGMTTAASMGVYLTYDPEVGRSDAERNCLSNIHPYGMSSAEAASKARALVGEALRLKLSGTALKELDGRLLANKNAGIE